jgi:hypothetical protein
MLARFFNNSKAGRTNMMSGISRFYIGKKAVGVIDFEEGNGRVILRYNPVPHV